jgi:hypothetical protein
VAWRCRLGLNLAPKAASNTKSKHHAAWEIGRRRKGAGRFAIDDDCPQSVRKPIFFKRSCDEFHGAVKNSASNCAGSFGLKRNGQFLGKDVLLMACVRCNAVHALKCWCPSDRGAFEDPKSSPTALSYYLHADFEVIPRITFAPSRTMSVEIHQKRFVCYSMLLSGCRYLSSQGCKSRKAITSLANSPVVGDVPVRFKDGMTSTDTSMHAYPKFVPSTFNQAQ